MSTYRLDKLFAPRSIAVVGASPRPGSLGLTFLRNLIAGGFEGELFPVNPHHVEIEGRPCFASLVRASRGARSHRRRGAAAKGARRDRGGWERRA